MVDGFEVDVDRTTHGARLVWPDLVEEPPVLLDLDAELVAVVDLEPVEVLVLEGAERSFADAVWFGDLRRVRMWINSGRFSM